MKIEDFTLCLIPGTEDATCEIDKYWKPAADGSKIAIGMKDGVKYQVKVRATEPKWKNNAMAVAALEAELRAATDDMTRERLEKRIASKRKKKENEDKIDEMYDKFLEMKQSIIEKVKSVGGGSLVIADEAWKQPISWLSDSVCYCEATRWQTVAVGPSCPVSYADAFPDAQSRYKVVVALATALARLHSAGIRHNDLKRPNTLILSKGDNPQVALIDFDAAFFLNEFVSHKYHAKVWNLILGGTYFAPEMLRLSEGLSASDLFEDKDKFLSEYDYKDITMASDIFSFGITAYEYIFDVESPMFDFVKDGERVKSNEYGAMLLAGYEIDFPDEVKSDPFLFAMMKWMLAVDPSDRPTAEQVAKAFTSGSLDDVSDKFLPEDLSSPWEEDGIEWIPEKIAADNVEIKRIRGQVGRYLVNYKSKSYSVTRRKDRLIEDGYAKAGGSAASGTAVAGGASSVDDKKTLWECDFGKTSERTLPSSVRRSGINGKYCIQNNLLGLFTFEQLKEKGFFFDDADKFKLWPADEEKGTIVSVGRIARNVEKGSGEYLLYSKDGSSFELFSFDRLVRAGHVTLKPTREICQPWSDNLEFVPENIPESVQSVSRSLNIFNPTDHTKYKYVQNGVTTVTREIDLLDRGWLRKK